MPPMGCGMADLDRRVHKPKETENTCFTEGVKSMVVRFYLNGKEYSADEISNIPVKSKRIEEILRQAERSIFTT
jgi:hypothetical protein